MAMPYRPEMPPGKNPALNGENASECFWAAEEPLHAETFLCPYITVMRFFLYPEGGWLDSRYPLYSVPAGILGDMVKTVARMDRLPEALQKAEYRAVITFEKLLPANDGRCDPETSQELFPE